MDKLNRYGPQVVPVAYETYGRLGNRSDQGLRELAAMVVQHAQAVGGSPPRRLFAKWRLDLERALAFGIADTTLQCLGRGYVAGGRARGGGTEE